VRLGVHSVDIGRSLGMSRRLIASVRVLELPHLHPDAIRIEVDCGRSTTGLTGVPGPLDLETPALITGAVFIHEQRCGCDTTEAYRRGDAALREMMEHAWRHIQAFATRRDVEGRWK
jgi:hypothetical protein